MTLNLSMPGQDELKPRISVFGVGGAGGNAVNNMIEQQLEGVEFVVANTDAQALQQSRADQKVQMGVKVTEGLGAGARATVGAAAAEESIEQIVDHLAGAHMCFITAGMGGGTGTGSAPIIAQAARELGVLTVGVVTKPFQFEGGKRMRQAEEGVEALQKVVDTLIIIPNQNLFRLANENTTFTEAFALADDVLYQGVKGVTDLMVRPGLINLDFADVRAVMDEMGKAMMGTGEAEGAERAVQAAEKAIANPLLDEISLEGAKGVLINITGGYDLTLFELDEAANKIREKVDPDANIIVGSTLDTGMEGQMRVSVVATGIDAAEKTSDVPLPRRSMAAPLTQQVEAEAPARQPDPEPDYQAAAEAAAEPTLFDGPGVDHDETAHEQAEDIFDAPAAAAAAEDDLPQPAYQPRVEAPDPQIDADPEGFVAPQRPAAGTTSPETLDRLRAAASRARGGEPGAQHPAQRAEPQDEARPRRGGLNGLINRMTGHGEEHRERAQPEVTSMPRQRAEAAEHSEPPAEDDVDPDEERIEIPAFLRRQAN
ncbi:cell division protein FtsZ [Salibaculum halophilum]|uniref:cell division protein FtsZ n=1 Tax=Salibaculum halophilum TaxID=1914408 RepID=UPI000A107319|nr:cell division protein FtsZ [Salibaculum halophilum]